MIAAMDIAFYTATALYVMAAVMATRYLWGADNRALLFANRMLAIGAGCLVVTFALRWGIWRRVPLTTVADSLNLLVLQVTVIMLFIVRKDSLRALLCFHVPPLAAICLINATLAHGKLHTPPRELRGFPLTAHVSLAFLAYALFLLASMTSMAYIFQAQRLKRCRTTGLFQRLPSLEQLDHTLCGLVRYGYMFFVITLVLGTVWAWVDQDLLATRWWLSPKVLLSVVMVFFYGLAFHGRQSGRLRGPKLAYLIFLGFFSLLIIYLVLALMGLNSYNFWGTAA